MGYGGSWGWGFSLGWGYRSPYWGGGWSGYYPWRLYWPRPVTYCYAPYGFYVDRPAVYAVEVVREVPVYVEETVVEESYIPSGGATVLTEPDGGAVVRTVEEQAPPPIDPAGSPGDGSQANEELPDPPFDSTTEKYLRDGSEAFAGADYTVAAENFRMAVVANPDAAPPRFAYGQALIALGDYPYAARVLRAALIKDQAILAVPGSISGVYKDAEEFDRVETSLRRAWLDDRDDADLLFLLGYQQYFSGDPQAVVTFDRLGEVRPEDPILQFMRPALEKRFSGLSQFPPSDKVEGK